MTNIKTYLSIDLDFWNQGKKSFPHMERFLLRVKSMVNKRNLLIVDSHEELLPHVNQSGCNNLINVDWHSDISNRFDPVYSKRHGWGKLNCGTWVNFVEFSKDGHFTWIHPYKAFATSKRGMCHYPHTPDHNPFVHPEYAGWTNVKEITSKTPENHIDWDSITHVGICYSFDWVIHRNGKIWNIAHNILGFRPEPNENAILF